MPSYKKLLVDGDNVSKLTNDAGYITSVGSVSYNDLTNKPTLFDGNYNSLSNKPSLFDGNYNSLSNKPTIPTNNNQLTNGAGYLTSHQSLASRMPLTGGTFSGDVNMGSSSVSNKITLGSTSWKNWYRLNKYWTEFSNNQNEGFKFISDGLENHIQFQINNRNQSGGNGVSSVTAYGSIYMNQNKKVATEEYVNSRGFLTSQTDSQQLSISSTTLSISGGNSVSLPIFDGQYSSLSGRPTIPTDYGDHSKQGYATQAWVQSQKYLTSETDSQTLSLSGSTLSISGGNNVSLPTYSTFSGSYNDLSNKPSLFDGNYNSLSNKPSIPTHTSHLTNNSGYITSTQNITGMSRYNEIRDTRSGDISPDNHVSHRMMTGFTNQIPSLSNWMSYMHMKGWSNGYASWELIGGSTTAVYEDLYVRFGKGSSWNGVKRLWHSGDFNSGNVSNWNTAYGWGNHADAKYLTSHQSLSGYATQSWVNSQGFLKSQTDSQTLSISGKTLTISSGNSITLPTDNNHLTSIRQTNADSTPNSTQFNNALVAPSGSSNRSTYFDGGPGVSSVSTWYGAGNKAYSAIDSSQTYMQFWVNNTGGSWKRMMDIFGDHSLVRANCNFQSTGVITASGGDSTSWNSAYSWGDHSKAGYLTSHQNISGKANVSNPSFTGRITGGFGAITTSGTLDWNHSSNAISGQGYTLLLGSATNGPDGTGNYYHPFSFEYSSKNGNGNMTQLAIPYLGGNIHYRTRYSGTWGSWKAMISSGNISSYADKTPSWVPNSNPGYLTSHQSLSGYATQSWVNSQGFLKSQTDSQTLSISGKSLTISSGNSVTLPFFDGNYNSLSNKPSIPTHTSHLTNNSGYITGLSYASLTSKPTHVVNGMLSGRSTHTPDTVGDGLGVTFNYAGTPAGIPGTDHSLMTMAYSSAWQTQMAQDWRQSGRMYIRGQNNGTWSSWYQQWSEADFANNSSNWNTAYGWGNHASAGYLTSHQSLSGYATQSWVQSQKYSTFSGSYNDLSNKPSIPTHTSHLTNNSGFLTSHQSISHKANLSGFTMTGAMQTTTASNYGLITGHPGGMEIRSSASGYAGLFGSDINNNFQYQIYGSGGTRYGFLASEWGSWDLRKEVGGKYYDNNQTTYYLQTNATSHLHTLSVAGTITSSSSITASGGNSSHWNTAYGWGNHASAGYLTSHQDISGKASLSGASFSGHVDVGSGTPFLYVGDATANNDGSWDSNIMLDSNAHARLRIENRGNNKNMELYSHTGTSEPTIRCTDSATHLRVGHSSNLIRFYSTYIDANSHGTSANWKQAYDWGNHASAGYLTSSSTINASTLGGLSLSGTTNNGANKVVRTDGNGYANFGWINTASGQTNATITRIYASYDGYIRYYTPSEFGKQIGQHIAYSALSGKPSLFSGSYNDLSNKPTIPTNNNQLTNGAGYVTTDTNTTYSAGTGMSLSGTTFNCTVVNTDTNTTYSAGTGITLSGTQFSIGQDVASNANVIFKNTQANGTFLANSTSTFKQNVQMDRDLTVTGTVTYGKLSQSKSDRRLKKDIQPLETPLDKVSKLEGKKFKWKDDNAQDFGVIAQEVEKVLPELTSEDKEGYKSVNYQGMIPYLIESIKELKNEIETLKSKTGECCNG